MSEDTVLTPGGLRPRSLVHELQPGYRVSGADGRLRTLDPSGQVVADHGLVPVKPRGFPLLPRNVNRPPRPGGVAPDLGSGWITYASWTNDTGTPVSRFATTWVVPPAPATRSGQTIFLFNGIQNSTMIYQPVLQWGSSAAGGGEYWSVASWYADGQGGTTFHSTLTQVNAGDVLTGVITLTGTAPAGDSYDCNFTGIANSNLPVTDIAELYWCIETLECYGITQCSDYPGTNKTAMASIDLATGATNPAVQWTVTNSVTDCGQHTLLFDDDSAGSGEVDIWYTSSPFWTTGYASIGAGASQDWWFTFAGNGDVGAQLIQAEPLNASGQLATVQIGESLDSAGDLVYHATVQNNGPTPIFFQWRGGERSTWTSGQGTLAAGASQDWSFAFGGNGDQGPQLIQAEPLDASGELDTVKIGESLNGNGFLTYYATATNNGSATVEFQWRGGGF